MQKLFLLLVLATCLSSGKIYATTWDEPWADQVIKGASSFILAKVLSCDEQKGISILVIKTIGGTELKDSLLINDFYLLDLCSNSGEGPEFHTPAIDSCYFFITQNKEGKYCIATPTTGFDFVKDGQVMATFRHSYHKAAVPVAIYEKAMTAVYNNYHNLPYDKEYIEGFVNEYLSKAPAGFSENEINTFFLQHVALECVHHLRLNINEKLLLPFLNDSNNFHNAISAARAMNAFNTETNKQELLKAIGDTTKRSFVRVMCVWSLAELKPKELKEQLQNLVPSASDESEGFGGNIMDPRICTHVPSVKKALEELIKEL
ncbi:MAG TPA: hypothetical protein VIM79_05300 [Niastella sp.]